MKSKIKKISTLFAFTLLAACQTTNNIPAKLRYDLFYGEAQYFAQRCTQYKSADLLTAVFAYCLANKAYNSRCPKSTADDFLKQSNIRFQETKAEFDSKSDSATCKVATSRYGKNGTVAKNLLKK